MASSHSTDSQDFGRWRSQVAGFLVATGFAAVFAFILIATAWSGPDASSGALMETINPNTATAASLARLPGIGWTRAQAIVAHRERVARERPEAVAFRSLEDLRRIRGIGPKTAQGLAPWLEFD